MLITRDEIPENNKWNANDIFKNDELWQKSFNVTQEDVQKIIQFKGTLESKESFIAFIKESYRLELELETLMVYAHMKHDENTKNDLYQTMNGNITYLMTIYAEHTSWFVPEFLELPKEIIDSHMNNPELKEYKFVFEKIIREKAYTLSANEEKILALSAQALQTASNAFSALNDADMSFSMIRDSQGKEHYLTHASYSQFLKSEDRELRKNAFFTYHQEYQKYATTFAAILQGEMDSQIFYAKSRNYKNSLEASLYPEAIDTKVYHNLINTVHSRIDALHSYTSFRKKKLGLDSLHFYDLYVPLVENTYKNIEYDEARKTVLDSVKPLGKEYQEILRKGLYEERWVDIYENKYKRSGAYSTGGYATKPFILLNYNNSFSSMSTLAHEVGHSMHSWYTSRTQPFQYNNYSIFLAEIASTFNEALLNQHILEHTSDPKIKAYLVNSMLEDIRTTFFRQVLFAEFELIIHNLSEEGTPLTVELLSTEYRKLYEFYYGKDLVIDKELEIEWARIPHFYYNFYVYQYATGISAATDLNRRVLKGGIEEREAYLQFLSTGSSVYPLDALKEAGVDMSTPEPIINTIHYFEELLDELQKLEEECHD